MLDDIEGVIDQTEVLYQSDILMWSRPKTGMVIPVSPVAKAMAAFPCGRTFREERQAGEDP